MACGQRFAWHLRNRQDLRWSGRDQGYRDVGRWRREISLSVQGVFTMCFHDMCFSICAIFCTLCFSIGSLFKNYAQKLFIFLCVCVEGRVVIMPLTYEYDDYDDDHDDDDNDNDNDDVDDDVDVLIVIFTISDLSFCIPPRNGRSLESLAVSSMGASNWNRQTAAAISGSKSWHLETLPNDLNTLPVGIWAGTSTGVANCALQHGRNPDQLEDSGRCVLHLITIYHDIFSICGYNGKNSVRDNCLAWMECSTVSCCVPCSLYLDIFRILWKICNQLIVLHLLIFVLFKACL